ncbi:MAG TPA: hypothetical protein VGG15_07445 [Terriglobales bacterium]
MDEVTSLTGPVEKVDGKLMLVIPMDAGGDRIYPFCKEISQVDGDNLRIMIPDWLAGTLRIDEGSIVSVDNRNSKLNITPVSPLPVH